ncbi:CAP domain-containing protein [Aestuariibacter halophilus]|uniref:CAP domain-containing protein n=1 Tax=Fluctibacter halophilus TaxID=226011 RepID=A0ABS8GBK6_9ALTE|nr:CAP domain-containing protein [Aestuariibacter halophilus]MCC2617969.1 CAP domain-containing protein [Aestuariibacter halophilus]
MKKGLVTTLTFACCLACSAIAGPVPSEGEVLAYQLGSMPVSDVDVQDCGNSPQARKLARLIMTDYGQQRTQLTCVPLLNAVALAKAQEMARKGMVTHYAGNLGANARLREAGYPLDPDYPSFYHNQVEAVAGGFATAEEAWRQFKDSPVHRTHLLAEHPFFAQQHEMGVAFIREWPSPHVEYWAVYIAKPFITETEPSDLSADD